MPPGWSNIEPGGPNDVTLYRGLSRKLIGWFVDPRSRCFPPPGTGPRRSLDSSWFVRLLHRATQQRTAVIRQAREPYGSHYRIGHLEHNERTPGPCLLACRTHVVLPTCRQQGNHSSQTGRSICSPCPSSPRPGIRVQGSLELSATGFKGQIDSVPAALVLAHRAAEIAIPEDEPNRDERASDAAWQALKERLHVETDAAMDHERRMSAIYSGVADDLACSRRSRGSSPARPRSRPSPTATSSPGLPTSPHRPNPRVTPLHRVRNPVITASTKVEPFGSPGWPSPAAGPPQLVTVGPRWGRARPDDQGQHRIVTVSRPRRSAAVSERSRRSSDHPDCLSHGGSRLCPRFDTIAIERRTIRTATEPRTQRCQGRQTRRAASRPRKARTGFPAGPGSPGRGSVGGRPRYGRRAACPPAPSG
jgi:hypothetical protein